MPSTRLSPEKWIAAGLDALAASGPGALAAEPLARTLKTTKGSFYWHFKDLPAYQRAVVEKWRKDALNDLAQAVASSAGADQQLRELGRKVLSDDKETAFRIWARTDAEVAGVLQGVDRERLTYISLLLRELGLGNADFARALQACLAGLPALPDVQRRDQLGVFNTLVDTVLAL